MTEGIQMTEEQKNKQVQAKDWRTKGLGWVPDYPDARDYTLDAREIQKEGKLRRNEVTIAIENLADVLAETIGLIGKDLIKDAAKKSIHIGKPVSNFEALKATLENKVFGGILFGKVKIHKILRKGTKNSENIVQLKYYLNFLRHHQNLVDFNYKVSEIFDKENYWQWMKSKEFDELTEQVIKRFQEVTCIKQDGIVGLETYSTIGDYLLDENKKTSVQTLSRIELLSVPSFILMIRSKLFLVS
ncbi:MAG: peptidoglycan-binding protein [Hydrococcus sp. RM1_1_31]|nr:peptidoglycan-binding protein [Hydrococcus sp. RM1_1_31]